jgi:16S rRNA (adenine1518-N6/adenine1519-N6)-dimethyltransferase
MPSKPRLGQNFLRDAEAIQRIANAMGDLSSETVIEIGPGQGAITGALASTAAQVMAIELDPNLAALLRSQFSEERVTVVQADVLGFDFAAASKAAGKRLVVAGNLPYYITFTHSAEAGGEPRRARPRHPDGAARGGRSNCRGPGIA